MENSYELVFLALIAGFVIFKLYNVVGKIGKEDIVKNNSSKSIIDIYPLSEETEEQKKDEIKQYSSNVKDSLKSKIDQIRQIDKNFDERKFMEGAHKAFEIILNSFAKADKVTLHRLLSKEVFESFWQEIDKRKNKKETLETTLVAIISAEYEDINIEKNLAHISVRFHSQQINLIKNSSGKIIEGDPSYIDDKFDIWTFTRNLTNRSLDWKLSHTSSI